MNNLVTSSMGNATAPDGASIAFTLHAASRATVRPHALASH